MIQSVLSDLGILLLMHLSINTLYHLQQQRKLSGNLIPYLHIFIVATAVISMFYFPGKNEGHLFDLRLIPLIFIAFFHGWRYTVPVLAIACSWLFFLGGEAIVHDILFRTILPVIVPMLTYPFGVNKTDYVKPFWIITSSWLISDLSIIWTTENGLEIFSSLALFRYGSFMLASLIMYFFIHTGIKHLELTKKLQFYAERDPLTGLYNMRKFEDQVKHYKVSNKQMFIAMVDIDRFKTINDNFGHQVGDAAIKGVAEIILSFCRKDMFVGRYGGDEYIFFIAAEQVEQVRFLMDSLRKQAAGTKILERIGVSHTPISLSIGIALLEKPCLLKEAIEQADKQLYLAKELGRNRVCIKTS